LWLRVLWFCIGLGIVCRFAGVNWDNAQASASRRAFPHHDRAGIALAAIGGMYFDTAALDAQPTESGECRTLRLRTVAAVLVKAVASVLGRDNYDDVLGVGRAMSALFDCISVLLLWRIGQKLGKPSTRCFRRGPAGSGAAPHSAVALLCR
jgi:hypothetical protein